MRLLVASSLISVFLVGILSAEQVEYENVCAVDYSVMFTIAQNERHPKKDIGYPYLISFNNKDDAIKAKNTLKLQSEWLDARTIDCKSLSGCKSTLAEINNLFIGNLDLGAFQINQKAFNYSDSSEYFNLKKSYKNACAIVYQHYRDTGKWDWGTIARYHSKTPVYNQAYKRRLVSNYEKIKTEEIN
jgi:hypothetical protein